MSIKPRAFGAQFRIAVAKWNQVAEAKVDSHKGY